MFRLSKIFGLIDYSERQNSSLHAVFKAYRFLIKVLYFTKIYNTILHKKYSRQGGTTIAWSQNHVIMKASLSYLARLSHHVLKNWLQYLVCFHFCFTLQGLLHLLKHICWAKSYDWMKSKCKTNIRLTINASEFHKHRIKNLIKLSTSQ